MKRTLVILALFAVVLIATVEQAETEQLIDVAAVEFVTSVDCTMFGTREACEECAFEDYQECNTCLWARECTMAQQQEEVNYCAGIQHETALACRMIDPMTPLLAEILSTTTPVSITAGLVAPIRVGICETLIESHVDGYGDLCHEMVGAECDISGGTGCVSATCETEDGITFDTEPDCYVRGVPVQD